MQGESPASGTQAPATTTAVTTSPAMTTTTPAASTTTPAASTTTQPPTQAVEAPTAEPATGSAPSGEEMPVGDLPGWHQIFTDDFTSDVPLGSFPAAVSDRWAAYPYPYKDSSKYGTYWPESVVSVSGGLLDKHIRTEGGVSMVAALLPRLPRPTLYGRYSVRYRFDSLPGYKVAWLLWPDSGDNQIDGEIDFPEMNLDATTVWAYSHRTDSTGSGDQAWFNAPMATGSWHTSTIEWSPNLVVFRYDGVEIGRTFERTPDTPMHWVLQTETSLTAGHAPDPSVDGHVQVDWVTAWAYDPSTADTTAPVVTDLSPADGSAVSGTTNLTVNATDDKAVVGVQFKVDGVKLGAELTAAPYTMPWNTMLLADGSTHAVSVVARDLAGNLTTVTSNVTVDNPVDTTPPTVTSVVPQVNGTIFPVGANMYAQFSEAVLGVDASSFTLRNTATGAVLPATVTYTLSANKAQASLNPVADLSNDTKYTLSLSSAITDLSGNPLAPYSWNFVTGPAPVATPASPLPGATNVSRTTTVTATASEDLTRVGTSTVSLTSSSGTVVSATVSFNATTDVVTLVPKTALAANTTYTMKLTNGIKDVVGNPLNNLTWTFTTGA